MEIKKEKIIEYINYIRVENDKEIERMRSENEEEVEAIEALLYATNIIVEKHS